MPERRDYDLAVYKVPRRDKNGNDITGDKVGAGGRHRGDGTYSGVAYDPEILDREAERRLSEPVRYEDLSPVGQIFVDGFEIAFTRLITYTKTVSIWTRKMACASPFDTIQSRNICGKRLKKVSKKTGW